MQDEMVGLGLDCEYNCSDLVGKPDIVIRSAHVAVFCDGDFWHGRNWPELERSLGHRANPDYWKAKIRYNAERDESVTMQLEAAGWRVIRIWNSDIVANPTRAASRVAAEVHQ